jgi:hypothetical protein
MGWTLRKFNVMSSLFRRSRAGAKRRRIGFKLTLTYIRQLYRDQDGKCALTGDALILARTSHTHAAGKTTASLDRIDSSRGYVVGNVQWVTKAVNQAKWDTPQDKFVELCRKVAKKFLIEGA